MFPGTLSDDAQDALAVLGKSGILNWAYLAGGSALALYLGHRRSVDFDFFPASKFDPMKIKQELEAHGSYESDQLAADTMLGVFNGVKFSLFAYTYPLIGQLVEFSGIRLASPEDIAAMKLVAITDRGTKKDFIDVYVLAKQRFSLKEMFDFYNRKYKMLEQNKLTLLKSLQYFEEAEASGMPVMMESIDWEAVKDFFRSEVVRLWQEVKK